jgi:hypothetical protein
VDLWYRACEENAAKPCDSFGGPRQPVRRLEGQSERRASSRGQAASMNGGSTSNSGHSSRASPAGREADHPLPPSVSQAASACYCISTSTSLASPAATVKAAAYWRSPC